jgi:prophage regulatory protein
MKILRTPDVLDVTGLSRATIWRKERAGTFPKRVRLGANAIGWRSDEIDKWLTSLPRGMGDGVSL